MKKLLAGIALALLIASPVAAKASITAPDGLAFGDTFTVEFTAPNHYNGGLWARGECHNADGIAWVQYVNLDDTSTQDGPFVLGPTPSWSGGGAECRVDLLVLNGYRADRVLASDDFEVRP